MKKMAEKKSSNYEGEMNLILQQLMSSVDHIRGNHLWFYFKSMIPRPEKATQNDDEETANREITSHIERGIDKITQKMDTVIQALSNFSEITDVKKDISSVEEMITDLKHWLETGSSKPDRDLKQQCEGVLPFLEDLSIQLAKLSEYHQKKIKERQKPHETDTPKLFKMHSDFEREKLKVQKLRDSLSSIGLTIDEAMDANKILDSMATSPRFLKAVRDRLAAREKSSYCSTSKRKLTLDDLLAWTDMPTEKDERGNVMRATKQKNQLLETTSQLCMEEGFLQVLNTQLTTKYESLAKRQKILNHKLQVAQDEERFLRFQLERTTSNISELKRKMDDVSKDRKMLDDFRSLAETYKK